MTSFHNGGYIKSSGKSYREKVTENKNPSDTISILESVNVVRSISIVQDNPNTYSGPAIPQPPQKRQTLVYQAPTDPRCQSEEECECSKWYCVTSLVDGEQKCLRLTARDALAYYPGVIGHDTEEECKTNCGYKWYCVNDILVGKKCKLLKIDNPQSTGYDTESECIAQDCTRKYYCLPNPSYAPNTGLGGIFNIPFICQHKFPTEPEVEGLTGYEFETQCEYECAKRWYCVADDFETSCVRLHPDEAETNSQIVSGPHLNQSECEEECVKRYYCLDNPITGNPQCVRRNITEPEVEGKTPYLTLADCSGDCQKKYYCVPNPSYAPNTGLGGTFDIPFICVYRSPNHPDVEGLTGYDTPEECETYCATKYYCLFDPITETYSCEEKLVTDSSVVGKTPYNSEEECAAACYYNQSQYFNIIP